MSIAQSATEPSKNDQPATVTAVPVRPRSESKPTATSARAQYMW